MIREIVYAESDRGGRAVEYLLVTLGIACLSAVVAFFAPLWFSRNPYLRASDVVGIKGISANCEIKNLSRRESATGYVAVTRSANCPGGFGVGEFYYVVFLHRVGAEEREENIVLQYSPALQLHGATATISPPPAVLWRDATTLQIKAPGPVDALNRKVNSIDGISIVYSERR